MSGFLTITERNYRRWIYAQSYVFVFLIPLTVFLSWANHDTKFIVIAYAFSVIVATLCLGEYIGLLKYDFSGTHTTDKRDLLVRYATGRALRVFYLTSISVIGLYHYINDHSQSILRAYTPFLMVVSFFILLALNHRLYKNKFIPQWHYRARLFGFSVSLIGLLGASALITMEEIHHMRVLQAEKKKLLKQKEETENQPPLSSNIQKN